MNDLPSRGATGFVILADAGFHALEYRQGDWLPVALWGRDDVLPWRRVPLPDQHLATASRALEEWFADTASHDSPLVRQQEIDLGGASGLPVVPSAYMAALYVAARPATEAMIRSLLSSGKDGVQGG